MSKFKVGDKVRRASKYSHGVVVFGGVYTVSGVRECDGALTLEEDTRLAWIYDDTKFELVQDIPEQPVLTPQEVFTAILEGTPLEYRTFRGSHWHTLSYPENVNIASFKLAEFRKQVQTVNLSGTVPKPVLYDAIEVTDMVYTVYSSNMHVDGVSGKYAQAGGLYWRTRAQAEQFRDALTKCFSTVPVLD